MARGGNYSADNVNAAREHAETYLRGVLDFIGVTDPEFIIAEGLALGDTVRTAAVDSAIEAAGKVSIPLAA